MVMESHHWHLDLAYDQWTALPISGPRPAARYKHAAAMVDESLYMVGGTRNGRYLSDVQVLDLRNLSWSTLKLTIDPNDDKVKDAGPPDVFPATSGHSMIKWGDKLLLLAGHSKNISDSVTVRFIDLKSNHCGVLGTSGKAPVARGGQSVSMVGSKLIMFGGEDPHRRLFNDVHVFDLETMTWKVLETMKTPPAPRFDHTAAVHSDRYLLIYGGCSHSIFFNDLHVLDLETMEWSQPQIQGELATPRAGHAGVTIDENWYMVGGGDNKSGASETLVLNMSKLSLSVLTSVKGRDPLASEGLSVASALIGGEKFLVSFGGYNGKYNNEVFAMRTKPRDSSQPKIFQSPAAAAAAASVTAAYALAKSEKLDYNVTQDSNLNGNQNKNTQIDWSLEINELREGKKALESSIAEVTNENSNHKLKIEETKTTYDELSKELHSVQSQLVAERSRCAKLEAQIAELKKMLESMQSIEEEVEALRSQKSAFERDMELNTPAQSQNSGGVWKWIAG